MIIEIYMGFSSLRTGSNPNEAKVQLKKGVGSSLPTGRKARKLLFVNIPPLKPTVYTHLFLKKRMESQG
jgi:hypothetical protein